jgi:hypothetical protein
MTTKPKVALQDGLRKSLHGALQEKGELKEVL